MKYKVINENITLESFESVREFTKICATRKPNNAFSGYNLASERHGRTSFYGTSSFEIANKIMAKGYKEGCKNLMQCKEGIHIKNDAQKSKENPRSEKIHIFVIVKKFYHIIPALGVSS